MDIPSITTGSAIPSQAESAGASIADTFDDFLTLLTTQLQHQDPLEPLDSSEFTQQLVQFSNVEQNIASNRNLEQLISLFQGTQDSAAVGYLGTVVEVTGSTSPLENGKAEWHYQLAEPAEQVTLTIADASGRLVWVGPGDTGLGKHNFVWDGNDNAGNPLPAGAYDLSVTARNSAGEILAPTIHANGKVSGIEFSDGETQLLLGDVAVPASHVRKLHLADEAV